MGLWHDKTITKLGGGGGLVGQSCLTLCDPTGCSPPAPLIMGFPRQEYWSGLPFPSPGDPPIPEIEPRSSALQAESLLTEPPGIILTIKTILILTIIADSYWVVFQETWWCLSVKSPKSSTGRQGLLWPCFKELTEMGQMGLVHFLICGCVVSRWWGPHPRHSDSLFWKWDPQTSSINNTCEFIKNVNYWAFSSFFVWFPCVWHVEYSGIVALEAMFSIPE